MEWRMAVVMEFHFFLLRVGGSFRGIRTHGVSSLLISPEISERRPTMAYTPAALSSLSIHARSLTLPLALLYQVFPKS